MSTSTFLETKIPSTMNKTETIYLLTNKIVLSFNIQASICNRRQVWICTSIRHWRAISVHPLIVKLWTFPKKTLKTVLTAFVLMILTAVHMNFAISNNESFLFIFLQKKTIVVLLIMSIHWNLFIALSNKSDTKRSLLLFLLLHQILKNTKTEVIVFILLFSFLLSGLFKSREKLFNCFVFYIYLVSIFCWVHTLCQGTGKDTNH